MLASHAGGHHSRRSKTRQDSVTAIDVSSAVPSDVTKVLDILSSAGFEAYIVGGAVRDLLLGLKPADYDVATSARPWDVIPLFRRAGWGISDWGVKYGVVSVTHPSTGRTVEISTFRRRIVHRPGLKRALVEEFADNLEDDAFRRDFTINALAMDRQGRVIDFVGGLRDLEDRVLRFVGDPRERIREDPLRILRGARFIAVYRLRIDPDSLQAIASSHGLLDSISSERIGEEIWKTAGKNVRGAWPDYIRFLHMTGLYKSRRLLPELGDMEKIEHPVSMYHMGETLYEHTLHVLDRLEEVAGPDPVLRLAGLLHDIGKIRTQTMGSDGLVRFPRHEVVGAEMAREILVDRWRLPHRIAGRVVRLVRLHMLPHQMLLPDPSRVARRILARMEGDWGMARMLLLHAMADSPRSRAIVYRMILQELDRFRAEQERPKPLLNGYDVIRLYGLEPGPEVGRVKRLLYEIQLEYGLQSREEIVRVACTKYRLCPNTE